MDGTPLDIATLDSPATGLGAIVEIPKPMRDQDALDDLETRLRQSGEFDKVQQVVDPTNQLRGSSSRKMAIIRHRGATEKPIGCNPIRYRRAVNYEVTIALSESVNGEAEGQAEIDRLASIAADEASKRPGLGGFTHPAENNIGGLRHDPNSPYPNQRGTMSGTFVYIVTPGQRDGTKR